MITAEDLRPLTIEEAAAMLESGALTRVLRVARHRAALQSSLADADRHLANAIEVARAHGYSWRLIAAAADEDENTIRVRTKRRDTAAVHRHDPYNGNPKRIARDAAAYRKRMSG